MKTLEKKELMSLVKKIRAVGQTLSFAQEVSEDPNGNAFEDKDGLISFVNLSSSFITSDEFATGQELCDKVCNFFSTMRLAVYGFLLQNPDDILPGDNPPTTQWDTAVTNYIKYLLSQAGGFSSYKITSETYSQTQIVAEFSTDFIKLLFDAAVVPEGVISDIVSFIQGIGNTLKASWDDKDRNYQVNMLTQCHEAVQTTSTDTRYVPKVKYYYISVNASQTAFTSNCAKVQKVTFDFIYDQYVTMLTAAVLDDTSEDYKNFSEFLDEAQDIAYTNASNKTKQILASKSNTSKQDIDMGVNFEEYPLLSVES